LKISKACNVRATVVDAIVAHAREAAPKECCGILLGHQDNIVDIVRSANLADDPNRFLIDPKIHFDALRNGRASGLDVVGFYHSHPHSPPIPSPTDVAEASYEHHFYLIVSLVTDPPSVNVYWLDAGRFEEVSS